MRNEKGQFVKGFTTETRPSTSVEVECGFCGKKFMVQPHRFKSGRGKYCSRHCSAKANAKNIPKRKGIPTGKCGDKCHFWKGGITPINKQIRMSLDIRIWREKVFERDGYTCQKCLKVGGHLQAHHIKSFANYPKLRFVVKNGITLCHNCHKLTDSYGKSKKFTS